MGWYTGIWLHMLGICIHKLRNIDIDTSGEIQRGEDDKYTVVSVMHINLIWWYFKKSNHKCCLNCFSSQKFNTFFQFGFPAALHLIVFQSKEWLWYVGLRLENLSFPLQKSSKNQQLSFKLPVTGSRIKNFLLQNACSRKKQDFLQ